MLMRLNIRPHGWPIAAIALIAAAFNRPPRTGTSTLQQPMATDPCAEVRDIANARTATDSMHSVSRGARAFIIANKWCVTGASPEYQDAQRFIDTNSMYGPVAKSISAPTLAGLASHT